MRIIQQDDRSPPPHPFLLKAHPRGGEIGEGGAPSYYHMPILQHCDLVLSYVCGLAQKILPKYLRNILFLGDAPQTPLSGLWSYAHSITMSQDTIIGLSAPLPHLLPVLHPCIPLLHQSPKLAMCML